jgi:acetylornithine/N-succinyldiaminopimelate aminotransferase
MKRSSQILPCHPTIDIDIVRAEGVYLYDRHGRAIVDFESGIWCASLGHGHPRIVACIQNQASRLIHLSPRHRSSLVEQAAAGILRHTPLPAGRVVFLSSGSEAMELGIRLARLATRRSRLLTFSRSYLGAFGAAGEIAGNPDTTLIDIDTCRDCGRPACESRCEQIAGLDGEAVAAFVLEPVLGSGGIILPPKMVVEYFAHSVRDSGGLVVVDEVTTGLGRTGSWLGIDHFEVQPDIIVLGKTLGNGYPVSAVVMSATVARRVEQERFYYVQSHQNDPLGCAVAGEVIATLEDENLIARSRQQGDCLLGHMARLKQECPVVKDVRGIGLMAAMTLRAEGDRRPDLVEEVVRRMLACGFFIGSNPKLGLLRFLPPFTITAGQIVRMYDSLRQILADCS